MKCRRCRKLYPYFVVKCPFCYGAQKLEPFKAKRVRVLKKEPIEQPFDVRLAIENYLKL